MTGLVAAELSIVSIDYRGKVACTSEAGHKLPESRARQNLDPFSGQKQHNTREEEIRKQYKQGRYTDRLGGRATNSLRSALHLQTLVAAYRRQNKTEEQGLAHPLHDIGERKRVKGARPEFYSPKTQR